MVYKDKYKYYKEKGLCTRCGSRPNNGKTLMCERCRTLSNASRTKYQRQIKLEVFNVYGGCRCNCCGENTFEFLQFDHINNDGNVHRKRLKDKSNGLVFLELKSQGFPPGYQILCANCHQGKTFLGICPHKIKEYKAWSQEMS